MADEEAQFGKWGPYDSKEYPALPDYIMTPLSESFSKYYDFISTAQKAVVEAIGTKEEDDFTIVSKDSKIKKAKKQTPQPTTTQVQPAPKKAPQINKQDGPKVKDFSCQIKNNWLLIGEVVKSKFEKECKTDVGKILFTSGQLFKFNDAMTKISAAHSVKLIQNEDKAAINPLTVYDDNVEKFYNAKLTAYISDAALAMILTAQISVQPWDLEVDKAEGAIFISGSDESAHKFFTVYENSNSVIEDTSDNGINNSKNISNEAWRVNNAFFQQSIGGEELPRIYPDTSVPHENTHMLEKGGYFYKMYAIHDDETKAVFKIGVRCKVDGFVKSKEQKGDETIEKNEYICIRSVLEPPNVKTGANWADIMKKGGNDIKNILRKEESCKMTRWAIQCMLVGVRKIMIGILSRTKSKQTDSHDILGTIEVAPEHVSGASINKANMWSALRAIIKYIIDKKDGKFRLVKDPIKNTIKIYETPEAAPEEQKAS